MVCVPRAEGFEVRFFSATVGLAVIITHMYPDIYRFREAHGPNLLETSMVQSLCSLAYDLVRVDGLHIDDEILSCYT